MNNDKVELSFLQRADAEIQTEYGFSLLDKFIDSDDVPVRDVLRTLVNTSMNYHDVDVWTIGKHLQREYPNVIPFKTELECSAGLWKLVRDNPELLK